MNKKRFSLFLALATLICCLFALAACGNDAEAKYYRLNADNTPSTTIYIELQNNNRWVDEKGKIGGYILTDGAVTLDIDGKELPAGKHYAEGTLKDGALKLTVRASETTYRASDTDPDMYCVLKSDNTLDETHYFKLDSAAKTWTTEAESNKGTLGGEDGNYELKKGEATYAEAVLDGSDLTVTVLESQNYQKEESNFPWTMILIIVVFVGILLWFFLSGRKNKTSEKEYAESIEAIKPGNKVTSRGGICGVVVEVCDDNTVIIETGSDASGKSRIKLMKEMIYDTDAKGPTQIAREEAELRKKAEKEAKDAAKQGKTGDAQQPSEVPAQEQPEVPAQEQPAADENKDGGSEE